MEKYGTVPPKFTKGWWQHYFYYYKFHALVVAFLIFMFGSIIYSNITRTQYDLHVAFVGSGGFSERAQEVIASYLELVTQEVSDDGRIEIKFVHHPIEQETAELALDDSASAFQMKFLAELQGGECDLYIMTKTAAEETLSLGENYIDITELVGADYPEEKIKRDAAGHPFAVSLADNEAFSEMGINSENLYLSVRKLYADYEEDEVRVKIHENSVRAAKLLLGE